MNDPINSPAHYTAIPARCACGHTLEPIDFTRHMGFNLGNVVKYVLRAPYKGRTAEDLRKAIWYINDELKRLDVKPPPKDSDIAEGYNPCSLTLQLVRLGMEKDWRLLDVGEEIDSNDQMWLGHLTQWATAGRCGRIVEDDERRITYRTLRSRT